MSLHDNSVSHLGSLERLQNWLITLLQFSYASSPVRTIKCCIINFFHGTFRILLQWYLNCGYIVMILNIYPWIEFAKSGLKLGILSVWSCIWVSSQCTLYSIDVVFLSDQLEPLSFPLCSWEVNLLSHQCSSFYFREWPT